jgi:hypothetical protein
MPGPKVMMPGGALHDASEYLGNSYLTEDHTSILSKPEQFIAHPKPGYHYGWAKVESSDTGSFIRSNKYEYVQEEDLIDDCQLPYETHKTPKGKEFIQVYDVCLVAIPPKVWEGLYKIREAMGVRAVARNLTRFYDKVDKAGGQADVKYTEEKVPTAFSMREDEDDDKVL